MTIISMEQTAPRPGLANSNVADIHQRVRTALDKGADIVVFPELANSGYVTDPDAVRDASEPLDGPFIDGLVKAVARSRSLIATGFLERDKDSAYYNSVVVVGADGPVLTYRKLHLFDAEQLVFTGGNALPVVETAHGILGVCVCYDLRFVEVMRALALKGADIILAPAAWVRGFDSTFLSDTDLVPQAQAAIVQANLNQVAVVAVSQVGTTPVARLLGGSVASDAYGNVLSVPLPRERATSAIVTVNVDEVRRSRSRGPRINPRLDRRRDVYALCCGEEKL